MTDHGNTALGFWRGKQGNDYIGRNSVEGDVTLNRQLMWQRILASCGPIQPASVLEVGCNVGRNLSTITKLLPDAKTFGLEPNDVAREQLRERSIIPNEHILSGTGSNVPMPNGAVDLAFTCGVLIHIPPANLLDVCSEIIRVSSRYVVAIEYFSAKPEMIVYRGEQDKLWKRDFGGFYKQKFGLIPLGCGFEWKETTGLDNLTWWVFRKP